MVKSFEQYIPEETQPDRAGLLLKPVLKVRELRADRLRRELMLAQAAQRQAEQLADEKEQLHQQGKQKNQSLEKTVVTQMLAQAGSLNTIEIARDKVEKLQKNTFDLLQTHIEAVQKAKEATIQTDEAKTRMAKAERAKEKTKQAIEWINLIKEEAF